MIHSQQANKLFLTERSLGCSVFQGLKFKKLNRSLGLVFFAYNLTKKLNQIISSS